MRSMALAVVAQVSTIESFLVGIILGLLAWFCWTIPDRDVPSD